MSCPVQKPSNRTLPSDWYNKLFQDLQTAKDTAQNTQKFRERLEQQLENERIRDLQHETEQANSSLSHRINDLAGWIKKIKKVFNHVELEIELLTAAKQSAEMALQDKSLPHDVNKFCLILRDRRANFELVQDSVEEKLLREAKLIESTKNTLNKKCNESFDLLCKLQTIRNELIDDLREKKSSMSVDCGQLSSKNRSPEFNLILPQLVKEEEEARARKSLERIKAAEAAMSLAQRVRDDIYKVIVQTEDAILNHKQKTDYEYHKRMHEIGIALDELQWQKKNIEDEMESLNELILNLEESLQAKTNKLKLIETRLVSARNEKCNESQKLLTEERNRLKALLKSLQKSIANTKGKINALQSTLHLIENNLRDKLITQQLDQACMEERKKVSLQNTNRNKQNVK